MSTRDELKRAYKEQPPAMGVFLLRHLASNRFLLGASRNVEGSLNKHRFMLNVAKPGDPHVLPGMLEDYRAGGADGFEFKVLDVLKPSDLPGRDPGDDLMELERLWRADLLLRGWTAY